MNSDKKQKLQEPSETKPKTMQVGNRTYKETPITDLIMSSKKEKKT